MPVRRERRRHINKMHHLSAKKFSQRICHRRQNDLRHLRPRRAHRLPRQLRLKSLPAFVFPLHSNPLPRAQLDAAGATRIIRDATMTDQKKTRRQMFEEFVTKKPDDPFSRYGLAMECMNSGDPAAAVTHFQTLLDRHADYVPAYLMYAQLLARESRPAEAKQILSTGIAAAAKKGDQHARSEMEALLTELLDRL
jgi:thioredoxin-like negative regulator of GroEL